MFKNIKRELYYQWKSGLIFSFLVFIIISSILISSVQIYSIKTSYDGIIRLNKEISLEYNKDSIERIINKSVYYNDKYKIEMKNHLGTYISSFVIELLIISICVYAITVSLYDFEKRTIKYKLINIGYGKLNESKLISIGIMVILGVAISILTYIATTECLKYIINFNNMSLVKIGIKERIIENINYLDILYQLLYVYSYAILFAYIAYIISQLFANKTISYIFLLVYFFVIPNLGVWDIKNQRVNIIFNIVKGSKESFSLSKIIIDNNLATHTIITIMTLIGTLTLLMLFNKKRFYNIINRF